MVSLLVIAALVAGGVSALSGDDKKPREEKIDILGSKLSAAEVADVTKDTMGTAKLEDVEETGPSDSSDSLLGTVSGGVRSFSLEAQPVRWEYRDGQRVAAWAYNGQVPGPALRANEGENVRIEFRNSLPVATTVHWHGIDLPWRQDGVPGVTQKAIEPGEAFTYEFKATPSGTRWYHTHGTGTDDEASQMDMGLAGAFIVRPKREVAADVDRVIVLDEWSIGAGGYNAAMLGPHAAHAAGAPSFNVFTLNGRSAPDTEEIVVKKGDRVRLRFVNASTVSYHPMHIHGHQARVVALDGNPTASPTVRNVELLAPGQTADIEFIANNPGVWMMHCHDLHHATSGMSLIVRYEGFQPISNEHGGGNDDSGDSDGDAGDDAEDTSGTEA